MCSGVWDTLKLCVCGRTRMHVYQVFMSLWGPVCVRVCVCLLPLIHPHPNILPLFGSRINMRWQFCVTLWIFDLCDVRRCGLIWKDYTGNEPLVWLPSTQKKKEEEEERRKKIFRWCVCREREKWKAFRFVFWTYLLILHLPPLSLSTSIPLGVWAQEDEWEWADVEERQCKDMWEIF